mmetsp:Transcript_124564/g.295594  ORF Transcript_124564/g.295594 Transcript_124564/m.295594 type:complete len:378 (+) Transcript_124564:33-1166(+)
MWPRLCMQRRCADVPHLRARKTNSSSTGVARAGRPATRPVRRDWAGDWIRRPWRAKDRSGALNHRAASHKRSTRASDQPREAGQQPQRRCRSRLGELGSAAASLALVHAVGEALLHVHQAGPRADPGQVLVDGPLGVQPAEALGPAQRLRRILGVVALEQPLHILVAGLPGLSGVTPSRHIAGELAPAQLQLGQNHLHLGEAGGGVSAWIPARVCRQVMVHGVLHLAVALLSWHRVVANLEGYRGVGFVVVASRAAGSRILTHKDVEAIFATHLQRRGVQLHGEAHATGVVRAIFEQVGQQRVGGLVGAAYSHGDHLLRDHPNCAQSGPLSRAGVHRQRDRGLIHGEVLALQGLAGHGDGVQARGLGFFVLAGPALL